MKQLFDPQAIQAQIENLASDRERIDRAIEALQAALRNVEEVKQGEFSIDLRLADTTLNDAVKRACLDLKDAITRQRVISRIEREHPFLKPKSASVAASLINLTKGDNPMLNVAVEGKGRTPSLYSIYGNTAHHLNNEEAKELFDDLTTRGTGGWQSLFAALQKNYNKIDGNIVLSSELRARIYQYYHSYGGGGWQERIRRIFRRESPHLFS
jgi:hypothetical protein